MADTRFRITATHPLPMESPPQPGLAHALFQTLEARGISYCHWGGNAFLADALAGERDLDVLIQRSQLGDGLLTLAELGFKEARPQLAPPIPGIWHFFGWDPQSDAWIHVHLHAALVTGERFLAGHQLPLEGILLEEPRTLMGVRVPRSEAELVMTTLRQGLRHGALPDWLALRSRRTADAAKLQWLLKGSDRGLAHELLTRDLPVVGTELFDRLLTHLEGGELSLRGWLLGRRLHFRLASFRLRGPAGRLAAYGSAIARALRGRIQRDRRRRSFAGGGALIAFVGAEATGKSTLVRNTREWLGTNFAIDTLHAGKPPSRWLTLPLNSLLRLVKRAGADGGGVPGDRDVTLLLAIRSVALAWDRRALLKDARQRASQGAIIVCDRYPSDEIGAMDSARLKPLGGGLARALARAEARLYRDIPPPDLVIRLASDLNTAKRRNRERVKFDKEDEAYVERRHLRNRPWRRAGTRTVVDVSTEQELEEVIAEVRGHIWSAL